MMLVVVLIVSFVTCSLAQTPCDTANQTLRMDSDCYEALLSVYPFSDGGNSRNATALMMVCGGSTDTTCNQNIRAYFDNCPSSMLNVIEVLCATSITHSNQYCVNVLPNLQLFDPVQSIFNPITEICRDSFLIGECNSECSVALQNLTITYGCCFPELLQFYNDIGSDFLSNTTYGLYLVALPTLLCNIQNPFCNGVPPPGDPDNCAAAFTSLYGVNGGQGDTCSLVIRSTITDDTSALGLYYAVSADCRARFQDFISSCSGVFDGVPQTEAIQRVNGGFALAVATNNGQSCSLAVSDILTQQNQGEVCIRNYFNRRCSYECRETLMSLTQRFGCCYNSFIAILIGFSTEPDDSIEYIILTREIFSLCDVQNPGLCTGISIPYSIPGERCVSAANQFYAQDDLCTNNYRLLGELSSVDSVQNGANGICTINTCRSRLNDYADYLLTCQVGNFASDDNNNDDDDDGLAYVRFSNITRYATCRMRSDGTSCYPVLMFSNMTNIINAAFDSITQSGACISIFLDGTCSNECAQLITQFFNSAGCCIAEYGNAIFGPTAIDMIARSCQIPSNSERCPEITDQQPDRCAIAQNVLLDSASTCGNAFFAFQNAAFDDDDDSDIDITTLRENLNQICQSESCKNAVSEYLEACADVGNSFDNDYEELRREFDGFACRQSNGNTQGDCFVLDNSDPAITVLGEAFVVGECQTAVSGSCTSECRDTLQTALNSGGCCVTIIGDVFFRQLQQFAGITTSVDEVAQACNLPIPRDCSMQTTVDGRGAAMERKGLGIMTLLLLAGMMITMLV